MPDYKYRGKIHDLHEPWPELEPAHPTCGTPAGYQTHRKLGEDICDPCYAAQSADQKARREARKAARKVPA